MKLQRQVFDAFVRALVGAILCARLKVSVLSMHTVLIVACVTA